ncbi:hypothetical protein BDD12DRAFT_886894 [Trichophaea hybrida]|nr:hypothetical protein BDD12DRAFT_886894 [Trichophaea hybrida]
MRASLVNSTDKGFAAAAKLNEAVDKYGDSEKPNENAFDVAFSTDEQYFTFLNARPAIAEVQIGGGVGHFSTQIAHLYPKLRLVVQDLPAVVAQGRVIVNARNQS